MFSYGKNITIDLTENKITQLIAPNGCLTGDHILNSRDGSSYTLKEICKKKLKIPLYGVNESLALVSTEIVDWIPQGKKPVYEIEFDDGTKLKATSNHRFYSRNGWEKLESLKEGDFVVSPKIFGISPENIVTQAFNSCGNVHHQRYLEWNFSKSQSYAILTSALNSLQIPCRKQFLETKTKVYVSRAADNLRLCVILLQYGVVNQLLKNKVEILRDKVVNSTDKTSYTFDVVPKAWTQKTTNIRANVILEHSLHGFDRATYGISPSNYSALAAAKYIKKLPFNIDPSTHSFHRIISKTLVGEEEVYDIETTCGNFLTHDILVHNSGKTSVAYIIQELLYSKNVKGIKKPDILNRFSGAKTWTGGLDFTVDQIPHKISVQRTGDTSKVRLLADNIDISDHKIPDTYKKLLNIFKMDFSLFTQLTYQSAKDMLEFLIATDSNRKKFLINLFKLDRYLEIGDIIKIHIKNAEKQLSEKTGELTAIQNFLNTTTISTKKELLELPTIDTSILERIVALKNEIANFTQQAVKINKNNVYKSELNKLTFDVAMAQPDSTDSKTAEGHLKQISATISAKTFEINQAKQQIAKLALSDTCYACGQTIDNTKNLQIKSTLENLITNTEQECITLKSSLQPYEQVITKYGQDLIAYSNNQAAIKRFEELSQLIDEGLPTTSPNYSSLEDSLASLQREQKEQDTRYNKALDKNKQIEAHNVRINMLQAQKRQYLATQQLVTEEQEALQAKLSRLEILQKAFSPNGIVAFKLEAFIKNLEDTINDYLIELSNGQFQLVFRLEGEKLNIIVISSGKESGIESVSAGEYNRIQTSILLAIRKLLQKITGSKINLLFLDEILGTLDPPGREKLIEILLEEKDLNVFLVSHEYEHPLVPKLYITKENDIARIDH